MDHLLLPTPGLKLGVLPSAKDEPLRLTYNFNQRGLSQRQSLLFDLKQKTLPITPVLKDQRVVISVDGGRTRIRCAKKGKRDRNSNRHGYKGEWIEPKLLTIYVVNPLLEMHVVRLGIFLASQVLLVADGANWIWQHIPARGQGLGCPPSSTHGLQGLLPRYRTFTYFCSCCFHSTVGTTNLVKATPVLNSNADNQLIYLSKCRL